MLKGIQVATIVNLFRDHPERSRIGPSHGQTRLWKGSACSTITIPLESHEKHPLKRPGISRSPVVSTDQLV